MLLYYAIILCYAMLLYYTKLVLYYVIIVCYYSRGHINNNIAYNNIISIISLLMII